jgi:ribose 5-phosphate isomerase A
MTSGAQRRAGVPQAKGSTPMVRDAVTMDDAKKAAGVHAAGYVEDGMRVGLGTGSTVHHTIVALGDRRPDITCTATSLRTHELATSLGLVVVSPDEIGHLDITIDGADEVDGELNLTKGGGGAHTREKIVAAMSDRFVIVVDESKLVERLGPFGTPLEVLEFAPGVVAAAVQALGATSVSTRDARSDNGNLLCDAHFPAIDDPVALAAALSGIPGIVEHGIFPGGMVERVIVAGADGTVTQRTH